MKSAAVLFLFVFHLTVCAQQNQNLEIAELASSEYPVYKSIEKGHANFKFEAAKKPWPVSFTKEGERCTQIVLKRAGIIEETYEADLPDYPAYYKSTSSEIVVSVISKKIYYYSWSVKTGSKIEYILSNKTPASYEEEKKELDTYRKSMKEMQAGARSERMEKNEALAAKEAAENSLEGKEIKAIRIQLVTPVADIGMLSVLSIGVEFELSNGTVLKTKNLGGKTPYTDFETEVKGGEYAGGDFKVASDSRKIPNDKIEIVVWSKYDSKKMKGAFSLPINYKNDIFYQYQGNHGSSGRGRTVGYSEHGGNGTNGKTVRITAEKKQVNGVTINHLVLTDGVTGSILAEAKLNTESMITVNVNGGNGGSGERGQNTTNGNGGNGGNGGNAGNVTLSGSGASVLKITVMNKGGSGGAGGEPKNMQLSKGSNGRAGNNGNFNK